jgi:hypothetical protein
MFNVLNLITQPRFCLFGILGWCYALFPVDIIFRARGKQLHTRRKRTSAIYSAICSRLGTAACLDLDLFRYFAALFYFLLMPFCFLVMLLLGL